MIRFFATMILVLILCSCDKQQPLPNILLVVVDDLGYSDLHCYGNVLVETPHIDQLAAEGIRFTSAYASCTVCSPTRAAILTGKNPAVLNLTDWIPGYQAVRGGPLPHQKLIVPPFNKHLPLEEITIAEMLQPAGYATVSIGKWHLGGEGYLPTDQGFDINIAGNHKGHPPSYYYPYTREGSPDIITPLELTGDSLYLTDRLTNEAIGFIRKHKAVPFFVYLPFYNVHTPLEGRPDLVQKYRNKLEGHMQDTILRNPHFLAMTEAVDDNVGRLISCLEEEGLDDNTLVIFTSDNGGLYLRQDSFIRASWNYPLRNGKGTLYEGGLRIPAIMRWKGKVPAGIESGELIISTDIFPTIMELTGIHYNHEIEGTSILAHLLYNEPVERETLYWHYPHYHLGMPGGVIREGEFKLIEFFESGDLELYNLHEDPGEAVNLVDRYPELAREMQQKLHTWRVRNRAQMPTPNPDYDPDYIPERNY